MLTKQEQRNKGITEQFFKVIKILRHLITFSFNTAAIFSREAQSAPRSNKLRKFHVKSHIQTSLWQWLRIHPPKQGMWVCFLVWEDPTCHRATKPMSHNDRRPSSGACEPRREAPARSSLRSTTPTHCHLKAWVRQQRPRAAKTN